MTFFPHEREKKDGATFLITFRSIFFFFFFFFTTPSSSSPVFFCCFFQRPTHTHNNQHKTGKKIAIFASSSSLLLLLRLETNRKGRGGSSMNKTLVCWLVCVCRKEIDTHKHRKKMIEGTDLERQKCQIWVVRQEKCCSPSSPLFLSTHSQSWFGGFLWSPSEQWSAALLLSPVASLLWESGETQIMVMLVAKECPKDHFHNTTCRREKETEMTGYIGEDKPPLLPSVRVISVTGDEEKGMQLFPE